MGPTYPAFFEDMARHADIVKVSDEDLTRIYPGRSVSDSIAALRTLTPGLVLLTCGSKGMTLWDGHTCIEQPAVIVDVADTVGAGDACIGGFLASLAAATERTLADHLRFAAATAAAVCMHAGAHAPSQAEVDRLLTGLPASPSDLQAQTPLPPQPQAQRSPQVSQ
jgi:fructokinase